MTPRTSPTLRASLRLAAIGLVAATAAAAHADGDWRLARVRSISSATRIDPAVDRQCAPARTDQPDSMEMVVAYRVGKASRWLAIDLPGQGEIHVGDEVRVNIADCRIEPVPNPEAAPASAP